MRRILIPAFIILSALVAGSPVLAFDLNPLSAIKSAVEAAAEDRSATDIAKDASIKGSIAASVIDEMGSDVISISSDVYEQDVMLTGIVEKAEQKEQAGKLTKAVENVKKVYNEILVVKDVDRKKGTAEGFVDDSVIESKINALLLDASGVNVTNFRWRSVDGHVFLFGRSLSDEELKKAVAVVKDIKNVIDVTNRVKVKPKDD
ncbi:MAG: BON domain-containing protein [Rhodospirillales bacterium]|nr:BON domain-containing protein [Rhodospirillales bacterium]